MAPLSHRAEPRADAGHSAFRDIHFPVGSTTRYRDDFGAPRSGGRRHQGNDLYAPKLSAVVSATSGVVVRTGLHNGRTLSGNYLVVRDGAGWELKYIHLNNDTPGTDDGANPPHWRFGPGIGVGAHVRAGQLLGYVGDSGNAESTPPHLHFEMHPPGHGPLNPWHSLAGARNVPAGTTCRAPFNPPRSPSAASGRGYWAFGPDGGVFAFGNVLYRGSMGGTRLAAPVVGMAGRNDGRGYWMVGRDGGIFSFGSARFFGSMGGIRLAAPIVGMAATPAGDGYWLVAADGGVFTFGKARFHGSTGGLRLAAPIVGMAARADGSGYWLLGRDGGVFSFGNAPFHGSTGGWRLNSPVTSIAARPDGAGYWLVGGDGGVFAFGRAGYHGSVPGTGNCGPVIVRAVAASATGRGYWMQSSDGRTWPFGDAVDHGELWDRGLRPPTAGLAAAGT